MTCDVARVAPVAEKHRRRVFQGIPGIQGTPGGRVYATWYGGGRGEGPDNFVMVGAGDSDGTDWRAPAWVVEPPAEGVRAYDPTLWLDPDGKLWLFWAETMSGRDGHIFDGRAGVWAAVAESPDDPDPVWSTPRRLADGIMMNKPIVLSNADWAFPISLWMDGIGGGTATGELEKRRGPGMVVTRDRGLTFEWRGAPKVRAPSFDEHHIVERGDGSLWMLIRTKYGMAQSFSDDAGYTWTDAAAGPGYGPDSRFFVMRLASGRLLMVNHRINVRRPFERANLEALLSDDDGATWKGGLLLDERANVSYPDGFQDAHGRIWVIYDRERYGDGEILFARFREEEVLAGRVTAGDTGLTKVIASLAADRAVAGS